MKRYWIGFLFMLLLVPLGYSQRSVEATDVICENTAGSFVIEWDDSCQTSKRFSFLYNGLVCDCYSQNGVKRFQRSDGVSGIWECFDPEYNAGKTSKFEIAHRKKASAFLRLSYVSDRQIVSESYCTNGVILFQNYATHRFAMISGILPQLSPEGLVRVQMGSFEEEDQVHYLTCETQSEKKEIIALFEDGSIARGFYAL